MPICAPTLRASVKEIEDLKDEKGHLRHQLKRFKSECESLLSAEEEEEMAQQQVKMETEGDGGDGDVPMGEEGGGSAAGGFTGGTSDTGGILEDQ